MNAAGTCRLAAWGAAAVLSLSVVRGTDAALGTSEKPAAIRGFAIVYRVAPNAGSGAGEIRVWFASPDRWRIENRTADRNETVVAAGDTVLWYAPTKKIALCQARDQATSYCTLSLSLAGGLRNLPELQREGQSEFASSKRLADDKVRGRECYVYETRVRWPGVEPLAEAFTTTRWVDKQLLVPLRVEERSDSILTQRIEALSVRVNKGVPDRLFRLNIPKSARVFKGAISDIAELDLADLRRPPSKVEAEFDFSSPRGESAQDIKYYAPTYLPPGFHVLSTSYGTKNEWLELQLVAGSGASIAIEQSRDTAERPLPGLAGGSAATVGGKPAEITERRQPFQRIVLTWDMPPWRLRIDAADVPKAQVVKIAESMTERTARTSDMPRYEAPAAAQASVHFVVLIPKQLPSGFRLSSSMVTQYRRSADGSETPEQVFIDYQGPGGKRFGLLEMRGEPGVTREGWDTIAIGRYPGWYRYDKQMGHQLGWVQDGTEIDLSGTVTKETLLAIARSLVPADPSAVEGVKQYQAEHPSERFGPGEPTLDLVAAQARLHFLVLVPKALPPGFRLSSSMVTQYRRSADGSETPEQAFMDYQGPGGKRFGLLEMRGWPTVPWHETFPVPQASDVTINGHPGWYRYDRVTGHEFSWVQDDTDVNLSGTVSKDTLLSMAKALVPADPSAAEEVAKYQAEHPVEPFGPGQPTLDLVAAQARLHFLVLVPGALPQPPQLMWAYVTEESHAPEGDTPEQIWMTYQAPAGERFSLMELRAWPQASEAESGRSSAGSAVTIAGHRGWYRYDRRAGHQFGWSQDGTEITLYGTMPKQQMLELAESLVPVDPAARKRVEEYRRQHSYGEDQESPMPRGKKLPAVTPASSPGAPERG